MRKKALGVFKLSRSEILLNYCVKFLKEQHSFDATVNDETLFTVRAQCKKLCKEIVYQSLEDKRKQFVIHCPDAYEEYEVWIDGLKLDKLCYALEQKFNIKTYTA